MKVYLASDHAGFEMKNALLEFIPKELGIEVEDCGAYTLDPSDDYPTYIARAAEEVSKDPDTTKAIVLGGSGQGEDIVADKFPHVRSIVYYGGNLDIITLSREHNDANVLSLGARFLTIEEAKEAVALWLSTPFSHDERHIRRLKEIEELESRNHE